MSTAPPRRVRITHPRTEAVRHAGVRPAVREIDEQTRLGEMYMQALIRTQRRLAVAVCASVVVVLGGVALLGAFSPRFARTRWVGIPVPWLALGLLIYPVLIGLAAYLVRQSERNEQAFTELLRRR